MIIIMIMIICCKLLWPRSLSVEIEDPILSYLIGMATVSVGRDQRSDLILSVWPRSLSVEIEDLANYYMCCIYICILHICVYIYIYTHTYVCVHILYMFIYIYIYICREREIYTYHILLHISYPIMVSQFNLDCMLLH